MICRCKNVDVAKALVTLPEGVTNLTLQLNSDSVGLFIVPPIDLYNISHLINLEYLAITHGYRQSINNLRFTPQTFENLTKLIELHINIITNNDDLDNITRFAEKLKVIDLTCTKYLNKRVVQNILTSCSFSSLNNLSLKSFQMPGVPGFSDVLNVSKSLGKSNSLHHLDLSKNMLGVIQPSIITMFPNLTFLDVSQNTLISQYNSPFLVELILHPSLEVLNLGHQGEGYVSNSSEMINSYHNKLDEKNLHLHSRIQYAFQCINNHTDGNVSCLVTKSTVFCAVVRCFMGQHSSYWQQIPCKVFGTIKDYLDFSCPYFIRLPILKRLKTVKADFLNWISIPSTLTAFEFCLSPTVLQYIYISNNKNWIHNSLYYGFLQKRPLSSILNEIQTVDISENSLVSFPNGTLPKLETLNAASNNIHISNESLCIKYPNLKILSLAQNNLSHLFSDIFIGCKYLEYIDLSRNFLNLSDNTLNINNNHMLGTVNLSSNKIDILPSYFTSQLDKISEKNRRLEININNNNLLCMCTHETTEFIAWFQKTRVAISDKDQISCSTPEGVRLLNMIAIDQFESACFSSSIAIIIHTIIASICVTIAVILIAAMYRYRWRIQFSMIKTFNRLCCQNKESVTDDGRKSQMKYDAFVSYCSDDRFWVHDCLMKTLESDLYGFKLCIHYRDFPLGEDISTVIINSIRQSRQLIIVLSKCSVTRPWCQLEFQVALSEAVRRGIKLVVIKLGKFTVDPAMDSSLAWVLDNHTYLEWKENSDAQKVFWFKLIRHLSGSIDGCCCFSSITVRSDAVSAFSSPDAESRPLL